MRGWKEYWKEKETRNLAAVGKKLKVSNTALATKIFVENIV